MKKTLIFLSAILIGAVVIFSCSKNKEQDNGTTYNSPKDNVIYSACYFFWQVIDGQDTCVNYYYPGQTPVICGIAYPGDPDCESVIIVGPKFAPKPNGDGYVMSSLTIYNYNQMDDVEKEAFDRILDEGEITIMDGFTINDADIAEMLGTDFVEGGTFPISLVDDKLVITLR